MSLQIHVNMWALQDQLAKESRLYVTLWTCENIGLGIDLRCLLTCLLAGRASGLLMVKILELLS